MLLTAVGCAKSSNQEAAQPISVKGSDTMVQLAQRWAEAYMQKDSTAHITVNGGGSGTGISALINGTIDICDASRPIKETERQQIQQKYGNPVVEIRAAKDGLTIFLNPANPVTTLSMAQLSDIYTGKVKNWKDVGGKDAPIVLYGRENSSGTYAFLKEHVMANQDYASNMQALPGTAAVVNAVQRDANGIGYGGAGYAKDVKECLMKKTEQDSAYAPKREFIDNDKYPLSRYLFMYLRKQPEGEIKKYIDWILSPDGQAIVEKEGFFPVNASTSNTAAK